MGRNERVEVFTEEELARLVYTLRRIGVEKRLPSYYLEPHWLLINPILAMNNYHDLPEIHSYVVSIPRKLFRALMEDIREATGIQMVLTGEHPITRRGIERMSEPANEVD